MIDIFADRAPVRSSSRGKHVSLFSFIKEPIWLNLEVFGDESSCGNQYWGENKAEIIRSACVCASAGPKQRQPRSHVSFFHTGGTFNHWAKDTSHDLNSSPPAKNKLGRSQQSGASEDRPRFGWTDPSCDRGRMTRQRRNEPRKVWINIPEFRRNKDNFTQCWMENTKRTKCTIFNSDRFLFQPVEMH